MSTKRSKPKLHLRTGDLVKVIAGNSKGKTGKILRTLPQQGKAVVAGVHLLTHYVKPTQQKPKGGIEKKEAPLSISNLMWVDPTTQQPSRVGRRRNAQQQWQRYAKKTGNFI